MKKIISILLIAVLSLSLFAACGKDSANETTAEATTAAAEKSYEFVDENGHKAIYGYTDLDDGTVKITSFESEHSFDELRMPDQIDSKNVTVIGEAAFKDVDKIINLKVPSTLIKIENNAFAGSTITTADLANSKVLTDIGDNVFSGCEELAKIELPDSLKNVSSTAFSSAPKLMYLTIRGDLSILDMSMFEGDNLKKIFTREDSTNVIKFAHDNKIAVYTINDNKEL